MPRTAVLPPNNNIDRASIQLQPSSARLVLQAALASKEQNTVMKVIVLTLKLRVPMESVLHLQRTANRYTLPRELMNVH